MSAMRSHLRQAGFMSNVLAIVLLTAPLPTHAQNTTGSAASSIETVTVAPHSRQAERQSIAR